MELSSNPVLAFFISLFTLCLLVALKNRKTPSRAQNLPPGSFGFPILGETLQFLFGNPEKFVFRRMKKHSPDIFKTKILGEKTAVICGPNGHKFLFTNEQKLFTGFRPHSIQKIFRSYQKTSLQQISREAESRILRSPGFLKPEALVRYLGVMDSITRDHIEKSWRGKDEIKAFPLAKTLTLTLASRFFLGIDDTHLISRLVSKFDDVTVGMHSVALNFPGTVFYRANRAAAAIRRELRFVINEKKTAMANGLVKQDILSHMIVATDPTGKHTAEAEIADKIMGLLVAGYSTVATAMTFFMKFVGERPEIYNKVFNEQIQVMEGKKEGEMLNWDDIQKMKYSWNVVYEVMRLIPPLQGTFREALSDFTYAGYTIPKGWKVYWTVTTTHANSNYFSDPDKFDPSRYEDGNTFPPFTFIPFGGGPRMCPGKEYARLAILTFVHNVVKNFKWEVVHANEKVIGDMMPTPEKGLSIRLHPHSLVKEA